MTRLATTFAACASENRAALVCFVTCGDPAPAATPAILDALVAAGADVIELGVPFTDPMAEGPAIQLANLRALGAGTTTAALFEIVRDFRTRHPDVPLVLMGYANPMVRRGPDWFADRCRDVGVDGVICVDIPPEEDAALGIPLRAAGVDLVRLATPTTSADRLPAVLANASGFLYYVSVAGITGKQQAESASIDAAVARLKASTDLPVAVGFGIRTSDQAAAIARTADGVVVGSALVETIAAAYARGESPVDAIMTYVGGLAQAVRTARTGVPA